MDLLGYCKILQHKQANYRIKTLKYGISIHFLLFLLEGSSTFHFKTLIPSVAAGAIIGKGGETIATLQKETSARVKMSKSHDFYPGA